DALDSIYNGSFDKIDDKTVTFRGGQNIVLGAQHNAIGLPMKTSKFSKFTADDYDKVYKTIVDKKVTIKNFQATTDVTKLGASNVKIEFVK
ncbi:MAG: hypothetical protein RR558_08845, partial [Coprobacillus sp.]